MAINFEITLPATFFSPDSDAQLVVGDNPFVFKVHEGRAVMQFDDTDEAAGVSGEFTWPDAYTGTGTLKGDILYYTASDNTNDAAFDLFVEAKTPNSDTLDMEATDSWDTANSGTASVSGSTAGDPRTMTITLSNKDSVASGDSVRIGIRRDCDSANDDIVGNVFVAWVRIYEET